MVRLLLNTKIYISDKNNISAKKIIENDFERKYYNYFDDKTSQILMLLLIKIHRRSW